MMRALVAGLVGLPLHGPAGAQTAPAAPAPFLAAPPTDLLVSNLVDVTVYDEQNRRIGEVEDLVMDGARGVRAVVVGVGALLGGGERHVLVDPGALRVERGANGSYRAVLAATADQVRAAPAFNYRGAWSE